MRVKTLELNFPYKRSDEFIRSKMKVSNKPYERDFYKYLGKTERITL